MRDGAIETLEQRLRSLAHVRVYQREHYSTCEHECIADRACTVKFLIMQADSAP
jgi:hypothetical protein